MYFYVYRDASIRRDYRWTLYAANHEKLANSGEGYRNLRDCVVITRRLSGLARVPIKFAPGVRPLSSLLRR